MKISRQINGIEMYDILDTLGSGGFGQKQNILKETEKISVKHTADFKDNVNYMAPEGQTTDYNHLIDVYSLALIGAKIFGFDSRDIRDGVYI
ncbi:unnamed protein product [Medioppia subpectinata]|uniref:Protein kinase domain-containing protein n=1 Tax=Medioppia subpectinata TaxID=1979941 RepID=A0A7R9KUV1_9ACAR|nr:unnamed protein product [Medioppia subpectinata]CAG2110130.1 unnamed protein product [Medioppia subpectinata]